MFTRLNKFFKGKKQNKQRSHKAGNALFLAPTPSQEAHKDNRSRGQVAIILLFIIALGLVFFAVTLNLGGFSRSKLIVSIASNSAAAQLASQMASYGHAIYEISLGGHDKICGWTGVMAAIIAFVIIVVSILLAQPEGVALALALISVGIAAVALTLQVAYIQPGVTNMWDKVTSETLSTRNQFVESAIRGAMQKVVTDTNTIPDLFDVDMDGVWGVVMPGSNNEPNDTTSLLTHYYNLRLTTVQKKESTRVLAFFEALKEFVYQGTDHWGLFDPLPGCPGHKCCFDFTKLGVNNTVPSECNPCCVPEQVINPDNPLEIIYPRPDCCDSSLPPEQRCGEVSRCGPNGPYGEAYKWVYDAYYENEENNYFGHQTGFVSLREELGQDDEHPIYYKNPNNPLGPQTGLNPYDWRMEDADGYYQGSWPPAGVDRTTSIHQLLYRSKDWGMNLSNLDINTYPEHCFNANYREYSNNSGYYPPAPLACQGSAVGETPPGVAQHKDLNGRYFSTGFKYDPDPFLDPTGKYGIVYGYSNEIDKPQNNVSHPNASLPSTIYLGIDKVEEPNNETEFEAQSEECAQEFVYNSDITAFWKRGNDRYCVSDSGTNWPYYFACPKHLHGTCTEPPENPEEPELPLDCACGEGGTDPNLFNEDIIDDLSLGIPYFWSWANTLLLQGEQTAIDTFDSWYPDAAEWIEHPGNCFMCDVNPQYGGDGWLHVWRKHIKAVNDRIQGWMYKSYASDPASPFGGACEAWCVPDASCSVHVEDEEKGPNAIAFDYNDNGVAGDLYDVIQCLRFNTNGYNYDPDLDNEEDFGIYPESGIGADNEQRFTQCAETCKFEELGPNGGMIPICDRLPRSIVPSDDPFFGGAGGYQYYPQDFNTPLRPAQEGDLAFFLKCLDDCNNTNCQAMPETYQIGSTTHHYFPVGIFGWSSTNPATHNFEGNECVWDPLLGHYAVDPGFEQLVYSEIIDDINPSCNYEWRENTKLSAREAANQVEKMKQRASFLNHIYSFAENASGEEGFLTQAEEQFDTFLDGPAEELINERKEWNLNSVAGDGLPYELIYVWQDEQKHDERPHEGEWHAIKVEVRTPGKCDNACGSDGGADPAWPRVKSWTKGWGTRRCFGMDNTNGMVKARVTRWDERKPKGNMMRFPSGASLWSFRTTHPFREKLPKANLAFYCADLIEETPQLWIDNGAFNPPPAPSIYSRGFMMNRYLESDDPETLEPKNKPCWRIVTKLLSRGTTSETCARYYWKKHSPNRGMQFQFVDCPGPF